VIDPEGNDVTPEKVKKIQSNKNNKEWNKIVQGSSWTFIRS
jgi:hypothetical protein